MKKAYGYYGTQFGSESKVDLETWSLRGSKKQIIRTAINQARNQGIEIRESGFNPDVRKISEAWIQTRRCKNNEIRFLIRPMLIDYREGTRYFYAYLNGEAVGSVRRREMREQVVQPAGTSIPRHRDGYYDVETQITKREHKIAQVKSAVRDPKLLERRLTELGIAESKRYGWNDTCTFTKWMGDVIHRLQEESKRNWKKYDRLFYNEPQHDFRVVGNATFRLMMGAMRTGVSVWSGIRRMFGTDGETKAMEKMPTTQTLAVTFSFYTQPRYRFHNKNLLSLVKRFRTHDKVLFLVDAKLINWTDYLCRIHMTGLNRYALRRKEATVMEAVTAQESTAPALSAEAAPKRLTPFK